MAKLSRFQQSVPFLSAYREDEITPPSICNESWGLYPMVWADHCHCVSSYLPHSLSATHLPAQESVTINQHKPVKNLWCPPVPDPVRINWYFMSMLTFVCVCVCVCVWGGGNDWMVVQMVHVCVIAHVHAGAHVQPTQFEKSTYSPRSQAANNGEKINPWEILWFILAIFWIEAWHASMFELTHASHSWNVFPLFRCSLLVMQLLILWTPSFPNVTPQGTCCMDFNLVLWQMSVLKSS